MLKSKIISISSPLKNWYHKNDNTLSKLDWVIFFLLISFCYVSFVQMDVFNTGGRAWQLYNSNFFNYYDVLHEWTGDWGANYMPTTFWLFAIWILPLKLLGFEEPASVFSNVFIYNMWYKLLTTLFYAGSSLLIYKICLLIGMNKNKAKICMFSFMSMPVVIYSQFIFSQYDIFTVFFMLLGIYFYLRDKQNDTLYFCLSFGVALTLKYYSLLIFAVLILLKEKRVFQLIKQTCIMSIFFLAEVAIYISSSCFKASVFGFSAVNYISQSDFSTIIGSMSFCKIACCFIVIWAYFVHPKTKDDLIKWALYLCSGICFGLFGFITWHPQWFLFVAPFWLLSAYINKNTEKFLWLDIVFCGVFYIFSANAWVSNADDATLFGGIWRIFLNGKTIYHHMNEFMPSIDRNTLYSILFVLIMVFFIFKHPKFTLDKLSDDDGHYHIWILRLRIFVAVFAYAVPAFCAMFTTLNTNYFATNSSENINWIPIYNNVKCEQYISGAEGELATVEINTATGNRTNTCNLSIDLIEKETNNVLKTVIAKPADVPNLKRYVFDFGGDITLEKDKHYILAIYSTDATENNSFFVGVGSDTTPDDECYAILSNDSSGAKYDCNVLLTTK